MNRRFFLRGLIAAPAVVAIGSLMPIRGIIMPVLVPARLHNSFAVWMDAGGNLHFLSGWQLPKTLSFDQRPAHIIHEETP